jgi:hypothetical protein
VWNRQRPSNSTIRIRSLSRSKTCADIGRTRASDIRTKRTARSAWDFRVSIAQTSFHCWSSGTTKKSKHRRSVLTCGLSATALIERIRRLFCRFRVVEVQKFRVSRITETPPELAEVDRHSRNLWHVADGGTILERVAANHYCQQTLHRAVNLSDDMAAAIAGVHRGVSRVPSARRISAANHEIIFRKRRHCGTQPRRVRSAW